MLRRVSRYRNPWDYATSMGLRRRPVGGDRLASNPQRGRYAGRPQNFLMHSAAAEFLLGSLSGLREGLCPDCAARMMDCTRDDMVKATKELILDGSVLAESAACSACTRVAVVARLRLPRF